jgi:hypothetical protein
MRTVRLNPFAATLPVVASGGVIAVVLTTVILALAGPAQAANQDGRCERHSGPWGTGEACFFSESWLRGGLSDFSGDHPANYDLYNYDLDLQNNYFRTVVPWRPLAGNIRSVCNTTLNMDLWLYPGTRFTGAPIRIHRTMGETVPIHCENVSMAVRSFRFWNAEI